MPYRLLAMDMDGTVLNSEKIVTPRTDRAIRQALAAGKEVLFATGRCLTEVRPYLEQYPEMRYALCLSGAVILDVAAGKTLADISLSPALTAQILDSARQVDAMVAIYAGDDVFVERSQRPRMGYFCCDCFAALYDRCAVYVDTLRQALDREGHRVHKINLYCHTAEDWRKAGELLGGLPVTCAQGIPNNFEISPRGVSKGEGLKQLCRAIGVPVEESIAVGDEGNDLTMVADAGLGVAMGNATAAVKAAAKVITADCDHDGVAEIIENYLL
ncbi:MAG: HAD family phosphatase [Oscillospiraceae bacterium]|nr:HAD family phosphatase [Oscillospiraceae bacterium]